MSHIYQCCGGFLRQLVQETTGRLEQGRETISDAYIHYYTTSYKLSYKLPSCLCLPIPSIASSHLPTPDG